MIQTFRNIIEPALPADCPFVIGGGLIRDAILGGRPGDIDIWVPDNISNSGLAHWVETLRNNLDLEQYPEIRAIFSGPGAEPNGRDFHTLVPIMEGETDYGDVNNRWVIEIDSPVFPKINIMRSMTPWTNPQDYFNGLMRAFDVDYCMFFVGYERGQSTVNKVIMPSHLANNLSTNTYAATRSFRINEFYWNQYRTQRTSQARITARLEKMCSKYNFANSPVMNGNRNLNNIIPTDQIIAEPVLLSSIMQRVNNFWGPIVQPRPNNRREPVENNRLGRV